MSNIGRAILKKLAVKFEGNEMLSIDDFDIFTCYRDLWKTKSEKRNAIRQGIISKKKLDEPNRKIRHFKNKNNGLIHKQNSLRGATEELKQVPSNP